MKYAAFIAMTATTPTARAYQKPPSRRPSGSPSALIRAVIDGWRASGRRHHRNVPRRPPRAVGRPPVSSSRRSASGEPSH